MTMRRNWRAHVGSPTSAWGASSSSHGRPATFDLITCLDVIEHVADDRVALAELHRVCRPGGFMLVTVPAYQALWSRHDEANHHYRRYSRGSLRGAATGAGWAIVRTSSFNSVLLVPAAAIRLGQRQFGSRNGYTNDLAVGPGMAQRPARAAVALRGRLVAARGHAPGRTVGPRCASEALDGRVRGGRGRLRQR